MLFEGRLIRGPTILDVFLINSWGGRLIRGSAYTRVGLYTSIYGMGFWQQTAIVIWGGYANNKTADIKEILFVLAF